MGIEVRTVLELRCDGSHTSGALPTSWIGTGIAYLEQRKAAQSAGWRFSTPGKVYGPCCPAIASTVARAGGD